MRAGPRRPACVAAVSEPGRSTCNPAWRRGQASSTEAPAPARSMPAVPATGRRDKKGKRREASSWLAPAPTWPADQVGRRCIEETRVDEPPRCNARALVTIVRIDDLGAPTIQQLHARTVSRTPGSRAQRQPPAMSIEPGRRERSHASARSGVCWLDRMVVGNIAMLSTVTQSDWIGAAADAPL